VNSTVVSGDRSVTRSLPSFARAASTSCSSCLRLGSGMIGIAPSLIYREGFFGPKPGPEPYVEPTTRSDPPAVPACVEPLLDWLGLPPVKAVFCLLAFPVSSCRSPPKDLPKVPATSRATSLSPCVFRPFSSATSLNLSPAAEAASLSRSPAVFAASESLFSRYPQSLPFHLRRGEGSCNSCAGCQACDGYCPRLLANDSFDRILS
jgi:hypothetical protein